MYSRKRSSGSWPTRIARRLAAALIRPELVSASIARVERGVHLLRIDDLVAQRFAVGLAGLHSRPERIAWRAAGRRRTAAAAGWRRRE